MILILLKHQPYTRKEGTAWFLDIKNIHRYKRLSIINAVLIFPDFLSPLNCKIFQSTEGFSLKTQTDLGARRTQTVILVFCSYHLPEEDDPTYKVEGEPHSILPAGVQSENIDCLVPLPNTVNIG